MSRTLDAVPWPLKVSLYGAQVKFTFSIQFNGPRGHLREKLVIAASGSEVPWHIALKFLGYLLFHEEKPSIERGVDWHYKPDLVSLDTHGRVKLWVDCGNIAVKKIDRVATWVGPDARFFILRRTRREAETLAVNMKGKIKHVGRVSLIWFGDGFVDHLARLLDSVNRITGSHTDEQLELNVSNRHGEIALTSKIHNG